MEKDAQRSPRFQATMDKVEELARAGDFVGALALLFEEYERSMDEEAAETGLTRQAIEEREFRQALDDVRRWRHEQEAVSGEQNVTD